MKYFGIVFALVFSFSLAAQKTVSLEDVWRKYSFYAKGVSGLNSMNDGLHYTTKKGGAVVKYSYQTGEEVETLFSANSIEEATGTKLTYGDYAFSADETKVLLSTKTEPIYRYSTKSVYYIYDLTNKKLTKLDDEKVRYATFSPAGNKVAYVKDNNLFLFDIENGEHKQITTDGETNTIINGATDWVYEEEFTVAKGFFWSPNGQYVAYYRFDESAVPEFSMDVYGKNLYPYQYEFKYPKAGEANSEVSAFIYDLNSGTSKQVLADEEYEYMPRIKWNSADNSLVIYTMNRHQNHLKLHKVNAATGESTLWFEETDEAYLEIDDNIRFLADGSFIWLSDRSGYSHLFHVKNDGSVKRQITSGKWEVTEFYGIDEDSGWLYYQSNEKHPSEKNIYRIKLNGKNKTLLTNGKGSNNADFSDGFNYFINTFSNTTTPPYVTLHNGSGKEIRVLKDNSGKKKLVDSYTMSEKEFFNLKTASGNELSAWMIKPLNFDSNKQYPVLMFVYGGPGSQQVLNQYDAFNGMWYQFLASQGYMIVCVDNRGTGGLGRDFRKMTYQQLGKYETQDQIEAAQYLASLPYVDGERIGIWGWSYGGYMSSNCLFQGPETFKLAIAVAPVTNWRFYDNIYTERYMRTPQENEDGYDLNSPINHVKGLEGNYMLIHGSGDDNVHVQNTMRMVEELVQANKQFELFIYPDKNHSIFGGNTRYHLYTMMTNFITENL
jgi:dipeptidyl-peptidase-4